MSVLINADSTGDVFGKTGWANAYSASTYDGHC
ncbi:hypothetical protein FOVG_17613 [Fusarium oxysporum f. sp. pisi HDV247]|uniref:Uncharacterized protein n=1 Tax=Fusarium oxysporum f. sp. pisi HDV247 TaxID=1080344 RepID=W9NTD6_FUSOX|nr:hypothetical protein FOVG_17613 [Fusarium oxysporum f. sp. pisi HDV247]